MARTSNKDKALAYAAERRIILTMEDADGDELGAGAIEVWSLDAHLSESGSDCHTYFARGNTEPRAWADALAYMERLTECPADCACNTTVQQWLKGSVSCRDQDKCPACRDDRRPCECGLL